MVSAPFEPAGSVAMGTNASSHVCGPSAHGLYTSCSVRDLEGARVMWYLAPPPPPPLPPMPLPRPMCALALREPRRDDWKEPVWVGNTRQTRESGIAGELFEDGLMLEACTPTPEPTIALCTLRHSMRSTCVAGRHHGHTTASVHVPACHQITYPTAAHASRYAHT